MTKFTRAVRAVLTQLRRDIKSALTRYRGVIGDAQDRHEMSELMKKAFKDRRAHQDNCPHRRDDGSSRLVHVQGDDEGFLICQFCLAVIFADNPRFHALTNLVTLIDTRLDLTPASEELDIHESDYQKWLMTAVHS